MAWTDKIFRYCERAGDPSFWAEPANALSNAAFIVAALLAAVTLARGQDGPTRRSEWMLVGLVLAIGVGSFLFHTYATCWASVADTAPIGIFMLAYLGYALRRFLGLPWLVVLIAVAAFVGSMRLAGDLPCVPGLLPITRAGGHPCFNGSLGYLPALAALMLVGLALAVRRHPAASRVLAAGLVFGASLAFRTLDFEVCALTEVMGKARGTHAVWHVLNAVTLYLLLAAAVGFGGTRRSSP